MARSWRTALSLRPMDPLDAQRLADRLDVAVLPLESLGLQQEDLYQLTEADSDSWSAITIAAFGREAIIVNPSHRDGRYASDVMHELAHLILGHEPNTVFFIGEEDLALRGYSRSVEEEASWLAGALLLPRNALVHIQRLRIPHDRVCETYKVSNQMLRYRLNVTGVNRQFARTRY